MIDINVKDFIQNNYTEYTGDESFLSPITNRTQILWNKCQELLKQEREAGGVLDIDTEHIAGINTFPPGYIDKGLELIVGLQTDKPLKRIINPYGGMRMVEKSLEAYNYELNSEIKKHFQEYRKTHNDAVFDVYPPDVRAARHSGLLTGLPDAYGRGRIIGDYRRIALYGIDKLIEEKIEVRKAYDDIIEYSDKIIDTRERIAEQIKALNEIAKLAETYGCDIRRPARTAQEAIQAIYFGYLAGAKQNNGAATSLGRVSTFIDIFIEKDLKTGILTEETAQELIDQFVIKLRLIRHLRTPEYDEMFGGDPTWVTESIGGMTLSGKSLVTKTSYRFLHTLYNLGTSPEPNLTILWSNNLPDNFKKYCAKVSIDTDAIQYENDDLMRQYYDDDYGIACCVSAMRIGKETQYFGARCNLAKVLLYAINGGRDENTGEIVIEGIPQIETQPLNYADVYRNFYLVLQKTSNIYIKANNIIHYMHDRYAYESAQMALHDVNPHYYMAFGVSGLSVVVDSLSAIKHEEVYGIKDKDTGLVIDFKRENENYPKYGNDIDQVDKIAIEIVEEFYYYLNKLPLHNNAEPTLSILTITSNVAYGKKTGATPDGRKAKEPFAPGANPMHNREESGALASLNSVSKIPYQYCRDGISNTFSIVPEALGKNNEERIDNLISILDGYFMFNGQHLNVNVLNRETLIKAYNNPEEYPNLTIRVSGYAVHFNKLSKEQQKEVIERTFHNAI